MVTHHRLGGGPESCLLESTESPVLKIARRWRTMSCVCGIIQRGALLPQGFGLSWLLELTHHDQFHAETEDQSS